MVLSQNEKFGCFITKSLSETSEKVYDEVYEMAFNRERAIHAHLENDFSCQKAYTLSISVDAPGSCVRLENMRLAYGDHYTGTYFAECGVTLHPEIGPDQEFDHWLVNDVVYDTQTLYLDACEHWDVLVCGGHIGHKGLSYREAGHQRGLFQGDCGLD